MTRRMMVKITLLVLVGCLLAGCSIPLSFFSSSGEEDYAAAIEKGMDGDYLVSAELCAKAIEKGLTTTGEDEVYNLMCSSYLNLDMYEEAIAAGEKALAINAENYICWTNIGVANRQNGNYPRAIECYNKALEINPDYPEVQSSLGTLHILQEDPEMAVTYFEKAISLDPSLAVSHGNLALALAMMDDFEGAEKALKQAKALGYQNYDVVQERIDALRGE